MSDDRRSQPVPFNDVFDLFSEADRRRLLLALYRSNPRDVDELLPEDVTVEGEDQDLVLQALEHTEIARLHVADYIEWDPETDTVAKGPRFDEIAPVVKLLHDHADELPDGWP